MAFQRAGPLSRKVFRTRLEAGIRNHQDKKQLVDQGRAHGILVYANGEPIGWCQYGPGNELPVVDASRTKPPLAPAEGTQKGWRVTCFVVDTKHRRNGVAGLALRTALDSIRTRGGGLVEAYPIASWTHGRGATQGAVCVQGVGLVAPAWGSFGNVSTSGTVSMFEKAGFKPVAVFGSAAARVRSLGAEGYRVLMRRAV